MRAPAFYVGSEQLRELRELLPRTWADLDAECVGGELDGDRIPVGMAEETAVEFGRALVLPGDGAYLLIPAHVRPGCSRLWLWLPPGISRVLVPRAWMIA